MTGPASWVSWSARGTRSSISLSCNIRASFQAVRDPVVWASSYEGGDDGQDKAGQRDGGAHKGGRHTTGLATPRRPIAVAARRRPVATESGPARTPRRPS